VRTPVDSPTYLGLSSQAEADETTVGLCENLLSAAGSDTNDPVFSDMTSGGAARFDMVGFVSILGGGRPVSFWKGASKTLGLRILGAGGPASSGVLKAFSQDPGRGSLGGAGIAAEKLGAGRPGTEMLDDKADIPGRTFSTFSTRSSAT
jgi:hypothetical protein